MGLLCESLIFPLLKNHSGLRMFQKVCPTELWDLCMLTDRKLEVSSGHSTAVLFDAGA